jgi:phosphoribosyl 1,2-cyclic phosphodiesterase
MKLKILSSSSAGNCYILENGEETLIIEAGIRFTDIKKAVDFKLHKITGCLISHRHGDHARSAKDCVEAGIFTLALRDVFEAKNIDTRNGRAKVIEFWKGYILGSFKIVPFPAFHDVACAGFIIDRPGCGRIMFLTDSCKCDYQFAGLNHILIECNWYAKKLIANINAGTVFASQRERLTDTHMELNTCREYLRGSDLSEVRNIILLHLSNDSSDETLFVSEIQKLTGKPVYAAGPGLNIDMSL